MGSVTSPPEQGSKPRHADGLRVRLLTATAFVLALLVGGALMSVIERSRIFKVKEVARVITSSHVHAIQERLGRSLSATYALAAVLAQGNGQIKDFDSLGQKMISTYGGISSLQLAENGVISAIVPLAGNEKALGHNLLEDAARNKEARLAMISRALTLAGPFELLQGGMAVVGRLPIFLPDAGKELRFWGFSIAVIRIPDLLLASDLDNLFQQGVRYQLWRIHPDTGQRQVIAASDAVAGATEQPLLEPVEVHFDVPNGQWTLSVAPVDGWSSPLRISLGLAGASFVAALIAALIYTLLRQPLLLRREVALRTQELSQSNQRLGEEILEREQSEARLELAASVFSHAREGITITDASGTIVEVNDTFSRITGYSREEAVGQNPRILQSGRQSPDFYAAMWQALADKGQWYGEVWNRRKSGEVYAEMLTISAVRDGAGVTQHYVSLFTDITPMKEHQQQLEHIAHFDALTDLPNRVLLADRLQQAMVQSQRRGQILAVAYLDLDSFQQVNDTHGHGVGDELLIVLAQHLKQALREGDTLARIGGDEFVAVLVDLQAPHDCEPVLDRLLLAASLPVALGDAVLHVSASIGVTLYPQDAVAVDLLIRHADQAMYLAKDAGKNRYRFFDIDSAEATRTQRETLGQIRRALDRDEFVLHYQPKVNMKTGAVVGAEALIRWQHPERGLLPPGLFLPMIEGHSISVNLGEWVIDTALAQISQWRAAGLDISVSLNVGAYQLQHGDFVARLTQALAAHPEVRPEQLELEIVETSALEDMFQVSELMHACLGLGVGFALDDFGTGYSPLTYLKRLPAALLKIDQSFVRDMLTDPDDLAIVQGVIGLASAFHRSVIAEGVETAAHGELLLKLGCEMAQGYGIARPMPAVDLPLWVERWQTKPLWTA